MAEGYGKIYESTWWGEGVDNNISWGEVYADLAGGGPKNTIAPVISGTAERGETLTSTTGTWTGTGTITFVYQWKRNGADISGATSSTYVLVAADDNALMTCAISATDTEGTKNATSNTLGPVLAAPLLLTSPVASGTAQVGQTLSTTDGTWQGIATIAFTYQWRRDASNIGGATSSAYTLVAADYTTDVDCVVTATNGLGNASADSNDIANIAGTAPIISGVPTISSQTQVGEVITATAASVSGVPTPTTAFQWQRSANGSTAWANISGATSNTYTLVLADDDKYIRAVQTSTNAISTDSANSAASAQISDVPAFTGLLNDYSGAAAAYSLRLLDNTYSGNAVRVRRASDNTEQNIGFANNELDTTSLETFCSGTDGFVATWYDQSGNANNAANATAAKQPQIVISGSTILENGKAALSFTNDYLVSAFSSSISITTASIVFDSSAGFNYFIFDDNNDVNRNSLYTTNSSTMRLYNAASLTHSISPETWGDQHLVSFVSDGANSKLGIDGSFTTGSVASNSMSGITLGASGELSLPMSGTMQEAIIYGSNQSTNLSGIETNINDHYSIY